MFSKLFISLLLVFTALGTPLEVTPEQLEDTFRIIQNDVYARQSDAAELFISLTNTLEKYGNETRNAIIAELDATAKLYWDEIALLEVIAESKNEDISQCVEDGNEEFYALNRSTISAVSANIDKILQNALNEVIECTDNSEKVLEKLQEFSERIDECSDDTCATVLQSELLEYYDEAVKTIDDATSAASDYVFVNLPALLSEVTIDIEAYQSSFESILDEIRACLDSNATTLNAM